jgi:F-type H+-transporting ATPase subunit delta
VAVAHRIYARALFDAAKEKGSLERVREELADLVAAIDQVPELQTVLGNPEVEQEVKAQILVDVLGDDSDEVTRNFVRLLAEKGRTAEIEQIAREFDALVAHEEGVLAVELTTALELTEDDFRSIVGQIEQASGRTVQATRSVDPELIGGLVLQAGSMRLDASVRGRLERLRQELATSRS